MIALSIVDQKRESFDQSISANEGRQFAEGEKIGVDQQLAAGEEAERVAELEAVNQSLDEVAAAVSFYFRL